LAGLLDPAGILPHNFHLPETSSEPKQYLWEHTSELREIDATRHIHLQVLYQWLEDSLMDAIDQAGWPLSRWLAAGYFTLQTRHDSEILELPGLGDSVSITSRLVDMHRLGGTWLQEVQRSVDGQLLAKDYSTGVFLNLNGRPASPPSEIFEAIQFG
jgi:acyl-CoA thioesterase FadM